MTAKTPPVIMPEGEFDDMVLDGVSIASLPRPRKNSGSCSTGSG
ncbi:MULTISPECIES: hypothetical protein [Rhizobium/Agrobacterium group]|nr:MULTISPECIES: hypothetical protein [Rhizobium/Agrobacterium group]